MAGSVVLDVGAGRIRRLVRAAVPVGSAVPAGGGGVDSVGDPHGIDLDIWDVLVRFNSYHQVDWSTNGTTWTQAVTPDQLVAAHPAGTVFKFVPDQGTRFYGWHCTSFLAGQTFKAPAGLRLLGARDLSGATWTASGGAWYTDVIAGTAPDYSNSQNMDDPTSPDGKPERVWIDDGAWLTHVSPTPGPGQFRVQYNTPSAGTHRVWIGDDPSTLTTIDYASEGPGGEWWAWGAGESQGVLPAGLALENVDVQAYPTPMFRSAIGGAPSNFLRDVDLRYVTVERCSGAAVQIASGATLDRCRLGWCGHIVLRGDCDDGEATHSVASILNTEVHHGGYIDGLNWDWEGGGHKLKHGKAGYLVRNSHYHDLRGMGIWQDNDSINEGGFLAESNLVEDLWGHGIFDEISDTAAGQERMIRWNRVLRTGIGPTDGSASDAGCGIAVSNTRHTKVVENAIDTLRTGLATFADLRSPGIIDVEILRNHVRAGAQRPVVRTRQNNGDTKYPDLVDGNHYHNLGGSSNYNDGSGNTDISGWNAKSFVGTDAEDLADVEPSLPAGATAYTVKHYGTVSL